MGKNRRRQAKTEKQPTQEGKQPRVAESPPSDPYPRWSFQRVDFDGPWCFSSMTWEQAKETLQKLGQLENMTFAQLRDQGSHPLNGGISTEAKKRLQEIAQDDAEERLYSLRVNGKPRVVGIRDRNVIYILWWDPEHEVCPSEKK